MWQATRARITGHSHEQNMLPCQDFAESQSTEECMVCVVADGASSAPLGEIGASIAVESIKRYFRDTSLCKLDSMTYRELSDDIKHYFNLYLSKKISEAKLSTRLSDYAATIAFIVIYEQFDYYLCGVIGDCVIIYFKTNGQATTIFDESTLHNTQRPSFITDSSALIHFGEGKLSNYLGFLITTDGCANGGLISFERQCNIDVINSIFKFLPVTQNPEMWLEKFIRKNIARFTGDDLSMYVIYNDIYQIEDERNIYCRMYKNSLQGNYPVTQFLSRTGGMSNGNTEKSMRDRKIKNKK